MEDDFVLRLSSRPPFFYTSFKNSQLKRRQILR